MLINNYYFVRPIIFMGLAVIGSAVSECCAARVDKIEPNEYPKRYIDDTLVKAELNIRLSKFTVQAKVTDSARIDNKKPIAVAYTDQSHHAPWRPASLGAGVFALEFQLQAVKQFDPVRVDAIRVFVESYQKLPNFRAEEADVKLGGEVPEYIYYSNIDPPRQGHRRTFPANLLQSEQKQNGSVKCDAERPYSFLVKVNARTPGLYDLEMEILLSHGTELQRILLRSFMRVAFFGQATAQAESNRNRSLVAPNKDNPFLLSTRMSP